MAFFSPFLSLPLRFSSFLSHFHFYFYIRYSLISFLYFLFYFYFFFFVLSLVPFACKRSHQKQPLQTSEGEKMSLPRCDRYFFILHFFFANESWRYQESFSVFFFFWFLIHFIFFVHKINVTFPHLQNVQINELFYNLF